jgi:cobalt/nickel transport system permease protein
MHIPDGYLGPAACGFFYLLMLPIWTVASRVVKKTLNARQVPMLAIGAAFSFVIMMFNIPIPGGTTGHAVGGVLAAILLGPWAACIAITVALVIQALLFGDGGITAIGANCFNMAFVFPFAGYYIYKTISYKSAINSKRRVLAAGIAGYIALNIAAGLTGFLFGIQPLLYKTSSGQALYCPYGLNVALPVMLGEHLLVFGWVEAIVTALVIKYLQKHASHLLNGASSNFSIGKKERKLGLTPFPRLWIFIGALVVLSPLGLLLPKYFKAGSAWLEKFPSLWSAPIPDYAFKGWEEKPLVNLSLAYIFSAAIGILICAGAVFISGKFFSKK